MDELFEIKPAFKAHKIMVQRLEEVDHHVETIPEGKVSDEVRSESV